VTQTPPDQTLVLDRGYAQMFVHANATGNIRGLVVTMIDPQGRTTTVLQGDVAPGATLSSSTLIVAPGAGTWTLRFTGEGSGVIGTNVQVG
jgi:hypothetical protein